MCEGYQSNIRFSYLYKFMFEWKTSYFAMKQQRYVSGYTAEAVR